MAISNDWTNKSLKIQQIDREQEARRAGMRAGMRNVLMMIAGKGGSPGQPYDDPEKGKGPFVPPPGKGMMISGNPSFDINETPATRRIRKIRTLQERGVGGEKGNAGDILDKGVKLPNIQASVTSQQIRNKLKPFTKGLRDYDSEGGGFIDNIPASLKIQLLKDAKA